MRVGIVTPRYPPNVAGGGEISAELLARHLRTDDRIERVVVLSFDGSKTEKREGVEVRRITDISSVLTEWQNLRAYRKIRQNAEEFDILHGYNMELYPALGAVAAKRDVATVGTLNSYHFFPKHTYHFSPERAPDVPISERLYEILGYPTTGRILRRYMRHIDSFISLSDALKQMYVANDFDSEKITVVPNMLDPSFSVPSAEETEGVNLLYLGEVSEKKGVDVLVRSMQHLPDEYRLQVVGDGPLAADLESLVESLGVSDRVTLAGYVDYERIPKEYAKADVFVHPGVWPEPFGRTIIEAMQAGLPVVCTNVGGPSEIVEDPRLKCPPDDSDALASAIENAVSAGSGLGAENRRYVNETFSPERVVSQVIDVYERTLSEK